MKKRDLTGEVYGRLKVIKKDEQKTKSGMTKWICKCDCGTIKSITLGNLISGTRSCGCFVRDRAREVFRTHGKTNTPEYQAWLHMKNRCLNNKTKKFENYGGRGIKVCNRWLGENGFENFLSDVGIRPSSEHSLDRWPNNETGNYEPGNVR